MIATARQINPANFAPQGMALSSRPAAILPLVAVLGQLSELVGAMSDEQYTMKPDEIMSSSVGSHVRHCLDHIEAILRGFETGMIDYDTRDRGTPVETCRTAAIEALGRQAQRLLRFPACSEHHPLQLKVTLTNSGPAVTVATSVGRELAFVLSHTIHHNALMAVIAKALGTPVPHRFGYAPSTIAYLEQNLCAR
jgi:uncharacterized damage-inducible protein DinB